MEETLDALRDDVRKLREVAEEWSSFGVQDPIVSRIMTNARVRMAQLVVLALILWRVW